jgi:hypothetical protein
LWKKLQASVSVWYLEKETIMPWAIRDSAVSRSSLNLFVRAISYLVSVVIATPLILADWFLKRIRTCTLSRNGSRRGIRIATMGELLSMIMLDSSSLVIEESDFFMKSMLLGSSLVNGLKENFSTDSIGNKVLAPSLFPKPIVVFE